MKYTLFLVSTKSGKAQSALAADKANRIRLARYQREGLKISDLGRRFAKSNGGYNLEQVYSHHDNAGKNYYLLLQVAHILNQLIEKGQPAKYIRQACGSIKNIGRLLMESIRKHPYPPKYEALFQKIFQIRLNTS